jgi:hypothetical protein
MDGLEGHIRQAMALQGMAGAQPARTLRVKTENACSTRWLEGMKAGSDLLALNSGATLAENEKRWWSL